MEFKRLLKKHEEQCQYLEICAIEYVEQMYPGVEFHFILIILSLKFYIFLIILIKYAFSSFKKLQTFQ